jgi:two-component system, chemotaxis family, protein-glutamate methylesterase/glutaminase
MMSDLSSSPLSETGSRRIRVLVVDDSSSTRLLLTRALTSDPEIVVAGDAGDAYSARDLIVQLKPDLMTLDIAMPRMDGITFLRRVMKHHPMPVIIVSGMAREGADVVVEALSAGALDVLQKPAGAASVADFTEDLVTRVKAVMRHGRVTNRAHEHSGGTAFRSGNGAFENAIFAMGASTGGIQALTEVLRVFPADAPPTLIAQHLPASFTASFAQRLDSICEVDVKEAADCDRAVSGQVLIAPGGSHMTVNRDSSGYYVHVRPGPPIRHQRPSVDLLFESVAQTAGANAVGAILTGMGDDGARGLRMMRNAGAHTIAQDQASSAVFGMPRAAIAENAVDEIIALNEIAAAMFAASQSRTLGV